MASSSEKSRRMTRKERQAQTWVQLLDAAEAVFLERGFNGSSVEEITARAGFTRGAFYSNFESKEQLFFELLTDRAQREYAEILERMPPDLTPREQLHFGAEALAELYERFDSREGHTIAGLWLECLAMAARDERFRKLAETFWRGNRALATERLKAEYEGREEELPVPPRDLATAVIALDIGLFLQHLVDPEEAPLSLYMPLYDLLIGRLVEGDAQEPAE